MSPGLVPDPERAGKDALTDSALALTFAELLTRVSHGKRQLSRALQVSEKQKRSQARGDAGVAWVCRWCQLHGDQEEQRGTGMGTGTGTGMGTGTEMGMG